MAIQTFVADTILTAAQMNALQGNDYNQTVNTSTASYVLIASDKGTKRVMNSASATTITVNTSLFSAGDTLTILNIGAGVCTVTAGTATVSTTGTLALVQNAGGTLYFTSAGVSVFQADGVAASTGGLVCVKAETAFSGAGTFTADTIFTSTYTNYLILVQYANASDATVTIQFRVGGVTTSTAYNWVGVQSGASVASTGVNAAASSLRVGESGGSSVISHMMLNIFAPQVASQTSVITQNLRFGSGSYANPNYQAFSGNQNSATQFDGFIISASTGNTAGNYAVYGYSKTV